MTKREQGLNMTDVELVIKIPEEIYETLKNDEWLKAGKTFVAKTLAVATAVVNGTPLPKGHGRLIDADNTLAKAWANFYKHEDEWEKKDKNYLPFGRLYGQNGFECCQQTIVNAPTIVDAEK
jgi:hypothetical protein